MKLRYVTSFPLILGLAVLLGAPTLYATPSLGSLTLTLMDGTVTHTVTIADGSVNDVNAGVPGVVTWSGSVGAWMVNVSTGLGYPLEGQGALDLTSLNATSTPGAGTLTILLSQNGYDVNSSGFDFVGGGTLSGTGASVSFALFGGNNNDLFDGSNTIAGGGTFTSSAFSFTTSGGGNTVTPYSLTERIAITASGTSPTNASASVHTTPRPTSVPEPASVLTLGIAFAGLVLCKTRLKL